MKKRLFIAFDLPDEVRKKINLPPYPLLRIIPPENLHITVLFLGYVNEKKIPEILKIIEKVSRNFSLITFKLEKIIFAPPNSTPRMVWALFEKNENYEKLNKELFDELREFNPDNYKENYIHINLARFRKILIKKNWEEIKLPEVQIQDFTADKITLYESVLRKSGPVYKILDEFPLAKN